VALGRDLRGHDRVVAGAADSRRRRHRPEQRPGPVGDLLLGRPVHADRPRWARLALFPPWFEGRNKLVDARTDGATAVVGQPAPPADISPDGIVLDVPAQSRHDEPFPVVVRGVPAGASTELSATGVDLAGRTWRSHARFPAAPSRVVDVAGAVEAGDWSGAAPDALIWAMRFAQDDATPEMFVPPAQPWAVTVEAVVGEVVARRTVRRVAAGEDVRLTPVDVSGMPGIMALPAGAGPGSGLPAVACFGGSEGGYDSQLGNAALLAAHGFVALAASWIDEAQAAKAIANVPLERFTSALAFLAAHESTAGPVAAMAISRARRVCSPRWPTIRARRRRGWCWSARAA
jgi:hypothetical protein